MFRFDKSSMDIYPSKKNVENFFEAVQNTFCPVPLVLEEHEFVSKDRGDLKRRANMPLIMRSSQSENGDTRSVQERSSLKNQPNLVVVVHLLPTLPEYLRALQRIGDIKIIIFKGAPASERPQHMQAMAEWVSTHNNFKDAVRSQVTKESLKRTGEAIRLISDAAKPNEAEVIIMDIGGYFAPCLSELGNKDSYPRLWKLLGIVEDTENGHQKYHDAKQSFSSNVTQPRIYSVARSQMKMTEDYNVGKSLVRAADTILRQTLDLRLEDHPVVGVIGFGKIGNSIAIHMRQQHIGKVIVYDVNPAIMLRAVSQDFVICSKEEMLQTASFIFCATGNKALIFNDLLHIGPSINRLIIGSCTSADDELDLHEDLKRYENSSDDRGNYSRYTIQRLDGTEVEIVLLCNGNAINFSCRAILGESIRSVQAAMMVCALNLLRSHTESVMGTNILTLTNEEEMTIARLWIQHFSKLDVRLITNVDSTSKIGNINLERSSSDLPVDHISMALLRQQLGLQRAAYTDPIDFMDSERKLIIAAPRGSGKSTVVSALVQDVRNYYDLIWWFDCSDSLHGCIVHLARVFHVFSIALSPEELQKAVLKVIFSSMTVNHFLLIVDNIQGPEGKKVTAESITDGSERIFQCHELLIALDKALRDPGVRHQRRRHIVALYTEDSVNLPPSQSSTKVAVNASKRVWIYLPLQGITRETTDNWICNKLSAFSRDSKRENRRKIIKDILSVDGRRLTIQLTAVLLTSEDVTNRDIKYSIGTALSEGSDILISLVKLALDKLKSLNRLSFICAQVVSLINSNYASREMFLRLIKILPSQEHFETDDTILTGRKPHEVSEHLVSSLKKFCILKKNVLFSTINTYTSGNYIPEDYLDVYNMPSTYGTALRKPLLSDTNDPVWNYVFQLVNGGFNYDYHADKERQHTQNIKHYFEHAYVLAKNAFDWDGSESNALLLADLLWCLGSYYLNEVRLYSKASESFRKSYRLIKKNTDSRRGTKVDDEKLLSLNITKWGAKLYWHICEQLTHRIDVQEDEKIIQKMQLCQKELMELAAPIAKSELQRKTNYQIETEIAIARIRVHNIRVAKLQIKSKNEILETVVRNLSQIMENNSIATRTESLMLQILGSAYSQLGKHAEAVTSLRRSLEQRRKLLTSEHVDLARTEYKLAYCLVQWGEDMKNSINETNMNELIRNVREARGLCETAFKTQRTQLPSDHNNLKECNNLRDRMNELERQWLSDDAR